MAILELELEGYAEVQADPTAHGYARLRQALGYPPLYHQWRTYMANSAEITVNSYNTGTGKTRAALTRLLDLHDKFLQNKNQRAANVLMIAPTNELLRQHANDIRSFVETNNLCYRVLRVDAALLREEGRQALGDSFTRQADRLHQLVQDPRQLLKDQYGYIPEGRYPYVLVVNPDIFYYALYMLYNQHERTLLFRDFVNNFGYIIVDEFHYYNAKQLGNFLFFLALLKEFQLFSDGRRVCLLTATPSDKVREFLAQLGVQVEYIEPGGEPENLPRVPALAPIRLRLYSAETLEEGLVELTRQEKSKLNQWLDEGKEGVIISGALWRINAIFQGLGGTHNSRLGRITGAETTAARQLHKLARLILATPTVDIGYNFERQGKHRQNVDFLLFDARSSDEVIQRLGRAGRVLGKSITGEYSEVVAVVPDELYTALQGYAGQKLSRVKFNRVVKETLPSSNGLFAYLSSGAIIEAFRPLYFYGGSLGRDVARVEQAFNTVQEVFGTAKSLSFKRVKIINRRFLELEKIISRLEQEARSETFTLGVASAQIAWLFQNTESNDEEVLTRLSDIDEGVAQKLRQDILKKNSSVDFKAARARSIEEFYAAKSRFSFRDSFQPIQVLTHDPQSLLSTAKYTRYSMLHIVQNYQAEWSDDPAIYAQMQANFNDNNFDDIKLCCTIRQLRNPRLRTFFILASSLRPKDWEEIYCGRVWAAQGFRLVSKDFPIPAEINRAMMNNYLSFYAVPAVGAEGRALNRLRKLTSIYPVKLEVSFPTGLSQEYLVVFGTAALLVACEKNIINSRYVTQHQASKGIHLFDFEETN